MSGGGGRINPFLFLLALLSPLPLQHTHLDITAATYSGGPGPHSRLSAQNEVSCAFFKPDLKWSPGKSAPEMSTHK